MKRKKPVVDWREQGVDLGTKKLFSKKELKWGYTRQYVY